MVGNGTVMGMMTSSSGMMHEGMVNNGGMVQLNNEGMVRNGGVMSGNGEVMYDERGADGGILAYPCTAPRNQDSGRSQK